MCDILTREHEKLYPQFKNKALPACQCGKNALFLHDNHLFKCALCMKPQQRLESVVLQAADLQPHDIFFVTQALEAVCSKINDTINQKIALLNAFRQQSIAGVMQFGQPQECTQIMKMQLQGKQEVIRGLFKQGYDKMCHSWLKLHEAKAKFEDKGRADLQLYVNGIISQVNLVSQAMLKTTPLLKLPELEQVNRFAFESHPRSIVCLGQDHFVVGTDNELVQFKAGTRSQLATKINVDALAVLPDGTLIGSDRNRKKLFQYSANKLHHLDYATFAGQCFGLWVRQDGHILYSDSKALKIMLLDRTRKRIIDFLDGQVKLDYPWGLAQMGGLLAIVNYNSNVLMLIDPGTKQLMHQVSVVDGVSLQNPQGLIAHEDRLLLCDRTNKRIIQVKVEPGLQISASSIQVNATALSPSACATTGYMASGNGRLLVVDYSHKQVLEFRPKQ